MSIVVRRGLSLARGGVFWVCALIAYALGWLVGGCATLFLWSVAAAIAGYKAARL